MAFKTALTDLLGIQVPIIQAPIGSGACPALAAGVSNAGGLGMLSMTWRDPREIPGLLQETKALTAKPFAVNLGLAWPQEERLDLCLKAGVPVISLFWGLPEQAMVDLIHDAGALYLQTVGNPDEARQACALGADVIIAQGWEAGGHVWSHIATMPLVPAVVDAVSPTPVVAAGGIADGRGLAAALMLGASGVWLGTRFLASREAYLHARYQQKVLAAQATDTVYTTLFDKGWPGAPHRVLRNTTYDQWQEAGMAPSGQRPGENDPIVTMENGDILERYSDMLPLPGMTGDVEALALYAGQSVGLVSTLQTAGEILQTLMAETEEVLSRHCRPGSFIL